MDDHNIDGHKLHLHPEEVVMWKHFRNDWVKIRNLFPIYVEVSPVSYCNSGCTFCGLDFVNQEKCVQINPIKLNEAIIDMGKFGVKSVMFGGAGEPLLYPNLADSLKWCRMVHMNSAITTNLTLELPDEAIKSCSWVKVSINGGTAKTYKAVHQRDHFEKVTMNMHKAVAKRQELKSRCTLGAQLVLLPENADSVEQLILAVKAIGFDYVVIKPYSQHLSSKTRKYNEINYNELGADYQQWESYSNGNFKVIVRARSMETWDMKQRNYRKCWSMPFFGAYVAENGDVYSCSCYIGNPDFKLGNIYGKSFSKIWLDREKNYRHVRERLDVSKCRVNCHFDKINEYLERVINPRSHDNFL